MRAQKLASGAIALAVLAAPGCGGSSTTMSLSKSELIARADAICKRVNERRSALVLTSTKDYADKLPPLAADERAANVQLETLVAPTSMAAAWKQMVSDSQAIATATLKASEDARAGNLAGFRNVVNAASPRQHDMLILGVRNGFRNCGQNPD